MAAAVRREALVRRTRWRSATKSTASTSKLCAWYHLQWQHFWLRAIIAAPVLGNDVDDASRPVCRRCQATVGLDERGKTTQIFPGPLLLAAFFDPPGFLLGA